MPADSAAGTPVAPVARADPGGHDEHGVHRADPYAWLARADDPEVAAHLAAERAYYDAAVAPLSGLRDRLAGEMAARVPDVERSPEWRHGAWWYSTTTVAGGEYPVLRRRPDAGGEPSGEHEVLLDGNALAAGTQYFELGITEVSPDGRLLAYSVDTDGDEVYRLRFLDLTTGEDLPDEVPRSYYGAAWSADSASLFYVVHDAAYRPYQVRRHVLGSDPRDDALVLQEDDDRFEVTVEASRSGSLVVITVYGRTTTEAWLVPADDPAAPPRVVEPRRWGVEYSVAHAPRADGDVLVIVTNDDAVEYRLMRAPLASPGREHWEELVGEDPAERLVAADVFAGHVVLSLRRDGSPLLRILRRDGAESAIDVHPGVPAGDIALGPNHEYDASDVLVRVGSFTEPDAWYRVDLATGQRRLVLRAETPGYDPAGHVSDRYAVESADGHLVPVTLVHRADVPLDGTAPCLLYGYGAYEAVVDPAFDPALSVLLDHGVVFAVAHIRGGGERGRWWWLDGHLDRKQHSFDDFVDVADGLDGLVDGARIVARGLSAGGLLMGAVYSQAPLRWAAVVAEVPFVDVVTTMLDPSLPLTAQEWEEWGDPRRRADFDWMLAYSPYDNPPPAADRPPLLVTGAVHDPRVLVHEPAKWVARLRATGSADGSLLFRVETGAGAHVGPSGRYARLGYEAEVLAWVLARLDAAG